MSSAAALKHLKNEKNQPKRGKRKAPKKLGVEEPLRTSWYDIIINNLKAADRKTFLHRIIYIGSHNFGKLDDLAYPYFSKTVSEVNNNGCLEPLTGFYLHYPHYFIHIVEGDEAGIYKHFDFLMSSKYFNFLNEVKILVDLCHISERIAPDWSTLLGIPKQLLNPPVYSSTQTVADTARYVFSSVTKLHNLLDKMNYKPDIDSLGQIESGSSLKQNPSSISAMFSAPVRFSTVEQLRYGSSLTSVVSASRLCPWRDFLPEAEILQYLLSSPYTQNLKDYVNLCAYAPVIQYTKDKVWPIPEDFIQYDVFDTTYDRNVDMLTGAAKRKKREVTDDDEEKKNAENNYI